MWDFIIGRIRGFGYAFQGLFYLIRSQKNAQIHLLAIAVIGIWGYYLDLEKWEWCAIFISMGLVLALEAINTAIECVVDLVSPKYHELAGRAKDVGAAAVLISVLFCGVVWGIIFLPKIFV